MTRRLRFPDPRPQPKPVLPPPPPPGSVLMRPDMIQIAQVLSGEVQGWQQRVNQAQINLQNYVNQCADVLGLDQAGYSFDAPTATFIPKPKPAEVAEK